MPEIQETFGTVLRDILEREASGSPHVADEAARLGSFSLAIQEALQDIVRDPVGAAVYGGAIRCLDETEHGNGSSVVQLGDGLSPLMLQVMCHLPSPGIERVDIEVTAVWQRPNETRHLEMLIPRFSVSTPVLAPSSVAKILRREAAYAIQAAFGDPRIGSRVRAVVTAATLSQAA